MAYKRKRPGAWGAMAGIGSAAYDAYNKGKAIYGGAKAVKQAWKGRPKKKQKTSKKWRPTKRKGKKRQYIDGAASSFGFKKHPLTKLNRYSSYVGAPVTYNEQIFMDNLKHASTDAANSQKVFYLATMYESATTQLHYQHFFENLPASHPLKNVNPITTSTQSYKWMFTNCRIQLEGTNMSPGSVNLTCYVIQSKRTATSTQHPYNDWNLGLDQISGLSGSTSVDAQRVGSHPNESKLFRLNWNIIDTKKYSVGPGGKLNYTYSFTPNRMVDLEEYTNATFVKGLTTYFMWVAYGQPGVSRNEGMPGQTVLMPVNTIWNRVMTTSYRLVQTFPRMIIQKYQLQGSTIAQILPVETREDDGEIEQQT